MTTVIFTHPSGLEHEMDTGHPECPDRLRAVERGLADAGLTSAVEWAMPEPVSREFLARLHEPHYVKSLAFAVPNQGLHRLDGDTAINAHSFDAARHAAGAVCDAVDSVLDGAAANAFCAVRPPGHHAERDRAMGFCLFGNVVAGARRALEERGLERVAIVDFDVHHGNGTEILCRDDPRILFCSVYQNPLFPFTDDVSRPGALIKSPLAAGAAGAEFRATVERDWWPALNTFRPQLILVSAGFDAHRADPLAGLELETNDYAWLGQQLVAAAARHCDGRLVASLEGGYDLAALAASAAAFVRELVYAKSPR